MKCYVSALNRYPIKSMGRVVLRDAVIDRFGIERDRRWMLIDAKGRFLTQRKISKMAQLAITENISNASWGLTVRSALDRVQVDTAKHFSNGAVRVNVWNDFCDARVADDAINLWFSRILKVDCRLVFMDDDYKRAVDNVFAGNGETVGFADGFPLLLTAQSSLDDLNSHLAHSIDMVRFRPNIVVDGDIAYAEDKWKQIRIGSMVFEVVKPCSRCVIPTINPATLEKEQDVLKALKQYRSIGTEVYFGQNLLAVGTGSIALGDDVEVVK